ncbi:YciI family protein [Pseudarthrobacter albicanus]|uniref:YciI family protein n=1 Tax=Pseudarthrobacter albicanus TaxID=2823873 RepID=UPI001FEAC6F3|nr:YciI family protein [Pseudarthrobacter albicanus]
MAQYALMVWGPSEYGKFGSYATAEENAAQLAATGVFTAKLREEGSLVFVNGLAEASASTVVDGRGPTPIFTDGPYMESKEYIAGFWIVEATDLDAALRLAAGGSRACRRKVEVRPMAGE